MTQQYLKYEKSSSSEFQTRLENNNIIEIRTTSLFNEFLLFSQPNAEFIFWQIYVKTSEIWVLFFKKIDHNALWTFFAYWAISVFEPNIYVDEKISFYLLYYLVDLFDDRLSSRNP